MLLKPLPKPRFHSKLFFTYKQGNEHLGLAKLNKEDLCFDTVYEIENDIKKFFEVGLIYPPDWDRIRNNYSSTDDYFTHSYKIPIENYCKLVWLTDAYINNGSLDHPVGTHYDPEIKQWRIHPGGSRQKILYLFATGMINTIAFNTTGKEITFDKIFNNWFEVQDHFTSTETQIVIVADHGTLIPHIHFTTAHSIIENIKNYYEKIVQYYSTTRIKTNFPISEYGYKQPANYNNIINISLDNPLDIKQQFIAFSLAPNFTTYHGYGVHIETVT